MSSRLRAPKVSVATLGALLCLALAPRSSSALNVNAVYRAACEREVGVILRVEKRQIHLLKQDGTVAKIPRHEIVSLVYYPVAQFPLARLPRADSVKPVRVQTRDQRKWVELAFGWPINFSERKMSLLLPSGEDFTVDKGSVWSLTYDTFASRERPTPPRMPRFEHPQTSGFCTVASEPVAASQPAASQPAADEPGASQLGAGQPAASQLGAGQPAASQPAASQPAASRPIASEPVVSQPIAQRRVFPQQILNDQVVIRRELNRLMEGYEELVEDINDQKFYPVPQIYKNRTSLGFWGSFFSRYAASKSRSNNLTPLLTNTFSSGPFRYQHIFFTGSTPNGMLIHNEAQTQIFYRFKAAYFHTSLLIDPNLALVGDKYFWRAEDLEDETLDDRVNEYAIVELGFDLGPVAIQLQPVSMAHGAVKHGSLLSTSRAIPLWRAGVRVAVADLTIEAMGGATPSGIEGEVTDGTQRSSGHSEWRYIYGRLNFSWVTPWHDIAVRWWTVIRHLTHQSTLWGQLSEERHEYRALSVSSALQLTYLFWHRFKLGVHFVVEVQRRELDQEPAQTRTLPKLSLFGSMSF